MFASQDAQPCASTNGRTASRFVKLGVESAWGGAPAAGEARGARPLLCDGSLLTIVRCLSPRQPTRRLSSALDTRSTQDHGHFAGNAAVKTFLANLGMAEFAPEFAAAEIDVMALGLLDEHDLRALGVHGASARQKLMQAVQALGCGA